MALVVGFEKMGFKATGVSVTVPNRDVCRLSYYLKCGTVDCGLDIIVDELLDFRNAHKLPKHKQDAIFRLAYDDFDITTLGNVTIFLDDAHCLLPRGETNQFFEVSKVQNILAIQQDAIIGGERKQVRKIMVCDSSWLNKFYAKPLKNNVRRLRRILAAKKADAEVEVLAGLLGALLTNGE